MIFRPAANHAVVDQWLLGYSRVGVLENICVAPQYMENEFEGWFLAACRLRPNRKIAISVATKLVAQAFELQYAPQEDPAGRAEDKDWLVKQEVPGAGQSSAPQYEVERVEEWWVRENFGVTDDGKVLLQACRTQPGTFVHIPPGAPNEGCDFVDGFIDAVRVHASLQLHLARHTVTPCSPLQPLTAVPLVRLAASDCLPPRVNAHVYGRLACFVPGVVG